MSYCMFGFPSGKPQYTRKGSCLERPMPSCREEPASEPEGTTGGMEGDAHVHDGFWIFALRAADKPCCSNSGRQCNIHEESRREGVRSQYTTQINDGTAIRHSGSQCDGDGRSLTTHPDAVKLLQQDHDWNA